MPSYPSLSVKNTGLCTRKTMSETSFEILYWKSPGNADIPRILCELAEVSNLNLSKIDIRL